MTTTDCRSETGITIGLIDSIITTARVLRYRDITATEIQEALEDLRQDEDVNYVINMLNNEDSKTK
jgi:hypothetical protein